MINLSVTTQTFPRDKSQIKLPKGKYYICRILHMTCTLSIRRENIFYKSLHDLAPAYLSSLIFDTSHSLNSESW